MFWLDDVEEVAVCVAVPDAVVLGATPGFDPVDSEIVGRVAFDLGEHDFGVVGVVLEVVVAFDCRDEGEEVFLELETDELFRSDIAHCLGPSWIRIVPGIVDGLSDEVDPSSICNGEGQRCP